MTEVLPLVQIFTMILVALAMVVMSWRMIAVSRAVREIEPRLQSLSDAIETVHGAVTKGLIAQDVALAETVRKMQAEVKSLELQLRDSGMTTRENPETVETAIRLVHEGYEAEQIVARTGLPAEVVESIVLFHGAR